MSEIDTSKETAKYWSEMIRFSERHYPPIYKYDPDHGLLSRFIESLAAERDAAEAEINVLKDNLNAAGYENIVLDETISTLRARVAALEAALKYSRGFVEGTVRSLFHGPAREEVQRGLDQIDAALSSPPAPATCNDSLQVEAVKESLTTDAPVSQAAAEYVAIDKDASVHDFCGSYEEAEEAAKDFVNQYRGGTTDEWPDSAAEIFICRVVAKATFVPSGGPNEDGIQDRFDVKIKRLDRLNGGEGE